MKRLLLSCLALLAAGAGADDLPAFPHGFHMEELGFECADCHAAATESERAADNLMPEDPGLCLECHDQGAVRMAWPAAERDLYFPHAQHVNQLSLECVDCHAAVLEAPGDGARALPSMDGCMTCHNGGAAPRDCEACHAADRAALRPQSHTAFWPQEHGGAASMRDAACMPCHAVSDCQECHDGAELIEHFELGAARQAPFAPQLEGSAGLVVQGVHGLGYRFLHGLEARGRSTECLTCHELDSGDFCAECHNPADSPGLRPAWHGDVNWTTLGAGSGGGRHAELARQDIENCAVCHDNTGGDPVCLQCHMDRTPGRGNDPQTHAGSFAEDIGEGDFHDDGGANCFLCHTRSSAPDGFCSYCHAAP